MKHSLSATLQISEQKTTSNVAVSLFAWGELPNLQLDVASVASLAYALGR